MKLSELNKIIAEDATPSDDAKKNFLRDRGGKNFEEDDKEGKVGSRIRDRVAARKARKSSSIVKTNMTGSIKEGKLTFMEFLLQEAEAHLPKE